MKSLEVGDYVLATKWGDGCARDHFVVGFYAGLLVDKFGDITDRHMVVDGEGKQFRMNGFRRCERVSGDIGDMIVKGMKLIEMGSASVWYWRYHPKQLKKLVETL